MSSDPLRSAVSQIRALVDRHTETDAIARCHPMPTGLVPISQLGPLVAELEALASASSSPQAKGEPKRDGLTPVILTDLLDALRLAQAWLANSVPLVHDGTPPLPIIAAAIAKAERLLPASLEEPQQP